MTSVAATAQVLVANCNGQGILLGAADQYDVRTNKALGAVVVDIRYHGARRMLLISPRADGQPLLEDISGEIAMKAGKGPTSSIEDVGVDTASFASDGSVAVKASAGGASGSIDLGRQIATERIREAAAAAH